MSTKCTTCDRALSAHCQHCRCCWPREVEHPDFCPVTQRRNARSTR